MVWTQVGNEKVWSKVRFFRRGPKHPSEERSLHHLKAHTQSNYKMLIKSNMGMLKRQVVGLSWEKIWLNRSVSTKTNCSVQLLYIWQSQFWHPSSLFLENFFGGCQKSLQEQLFGCELPSTLIDLLVEDAPKTLDRITVRGGRRQHNEFLSLCVHRSQWCR